MTETLNHWYGKRIAKEYLLSRDFNDKEIFFEHGIRVIRYSNKKGFYSSICRRIDVVGIKHRNKKILIEVGDLHGGNMRQLRRSCEEYYHIDKISKDTFYIVNTTIKRLKNEIEYWKDKCHNLKSNKSFSIGFILPDIKEII